MDKLSEVRESVLELKVKLEGAIEIIKISGTMNKSEQVEFVSMLVDITNRIYKKARE